MHEFVPYIHSQLSQVLGDVNSFIPEIYLSALFVVVLLTDILFGRNSEKLCRIVACAGMVLVILQDWRQVLTIDRDHINFLFDGMLLQNHTSLILRLIIDKLGLTLLLFFGWDSQLRGHNKGLSDLYSIAIATILGLHLMTMAANLLSVFLAIEMVSLGSYLLVAYQTESAFSTEAGLKYILFGAAASAIMLYGMSLLYGFTGSLSLYTPDFMPALIQANKTGVVFAIILILIGVGFKLSFVPLHFWVPDVYEGAPTSVTAFLSTLPKIAGFGLLINILTPFISNLQWKSFDFGLYLSVIGIITMIAGNFAAIAQANIKRMLAYSSIGHTGFALMAIVTFTSEGVTALLFYLGMYAIANIAALMLVSYFSRITGSEDVNTYKGLGFKYPAASVCFIILMISLTGLPVTAGFTGKLMVFSTVFRTYQQGHNVWMLLLAATGAITTVVSLFYYIKIPLNLFIKRSENTDETISSSAYLLVFGLLISIALVCIGIFPDVITQYL